MEFLEEVERTTGETPKALQDRPALHPWLRPILDAFYLLSTGRAFGMAPCPIPTTDILAYASVVGRAPLELLRIIRALDIAYLEAMDARNRKK